jgi:[ribosomal protein S5]-alanine N-acetyltransferase
MKTPVLETERLILRPMTLEDAPAVQKYFGNWNVIKYLNTVVPWPYPKHGAMDWLKFAVSQMQAGKMCEWGILLKEKPDEIIGAATVKKKDDGTIQRDFWLGEPFWNKGYMTEAVHAVNDFIFFELNAETLQIHNAISNIGSRRVKQKTGAVFIKEIPQEYHNGDKIGELWEVTKENWGKIRKSKWPSLRGAEGDEEIHLVDSRLLRSARNDD